MEFAGIPTTVVTGGAGANIGSTISKSLANAGAEVLILDTDQEAATGVIDDIRDTGGYASMFECDVTDEKRVKTILNTIAAEFDGIDMLVNNAGGASGTHIQDIDPETFDYNLNVNLRSAFFTTQAALPHLKGSDYGSVIFISSINALLGGFSEVAYAVAKAGLHALARSLTADYGKDGIRFNVIAPGSIIGDSETWAQREAESPGTLDSLATLYPRGRYGDPQDVAEAVLFLSSNRSDWISGVVLPVDGGLTATGALPGGDWWETL